MNSDEPISQIPAYLVVSVGDRQDTGDQRGSNGEANSGVILQAVQLIKDFLQCGGDLREMDSLNTAREELITPRQHSIKGDGGRHIFELLQGNEHFVNGRQEAAIKGLDG